MNSILKDIETEVVKCMKCGNCQAVCPLYKENHSEAAVARGKIRLAEAVLNGEVDYTAGLAHRFDMCLTCLACVENCPCGVRVDKIILSLRAALTDNRGLPWPQRAALNALSRPKLMDKGVKTAGITQGLFFKRGGKGISPRFPIGLSTRRVLPSPARKTLKEQVAEKNAVSNPVMRVAFFAGCTTNYLYPEVGKALLEVLQKHGVEVIFPRAQHCCGTPVVIHGARDTAREMAISHVDMFSKVEADAIITVCGTCGEAFRQYYPELLSDIPDYSSKAQKLTDKTYDISEFFTDVLPLNKKLLGPVNESFTYHEPCHIGRGMGAAGKPEELLKLIPGAKYIPMKDPGRCCGGAGSFSFERPELSFSVLEHKLKDIKSTGANTVVTGCGSCRMQINDGLGQQNMHQNVIHTIEMLAKSVRNAG
ncbi:MAG: (Fe-S)-binding protein [Clostridiales bacterium]|nr:(Fe-S)-binding protein [Clostridiales bacterium]MCF8023756.1 (Fe-S)-binding protein [Clostridiales bacterium]